MNRNRNTAELWAIDSQETQELIENIERRGLHIIHVFTASSVPVLKHKSVILSGFGNIKSMFVSNYSSHAEKVDD